MVPRQRALLGGLFLPVPSAAAFAPAVLSFTLFGVGIAEVLRRHLQVHAHRAGRPLRALSTAAAVAGTGYTSRSRPGASTRWASCLGLLTCEACSLIRDDRDATGRRALIVNLFGRAVLPFFNSSMASMWSIQYSSTTRSIITRSSSRMSSSPRDDSLAL